MGHPVRKCARVIANLVVEILDSPTIAIGLFCHLIVPIDRYHAIKQFSITNQNTGPIPWSSFDWLPINHQEACGGFGNGIQ